MIFQQRPKNSINTYLSELAILINNYHKGVFPDDLKLADISVMPAHVECAKHAFNVLTLLTKNCNVFFSLRTPLL